MRPAQTLGFGDDGQPVLKVAEDGTMPTEEEILAFLEKGKKKQAAKEGAEGEKEEKNDNDKEEKNDKHDEL